ncbi:type II toxin-antitoxin system VapC family toxin [Acinetobacter qingfengensis]|uniref:type II toxin-antitoxin system VapC family toxin n=1 Tax=Acinetobacter qingfengensis TaxID=1262585 RepID=UPI000AB1FD9E|nr:pilus assembly protein [Acinetobacter qingfengensis]
MTKIKLCFFFTLLVLTSLAYTESSPNKTTTAVMTEVLHMIDFNVNVQVDFLEWVAQEGILLQEISQQDIHRIIELTRKYSDRPMDFADATLVITAEKTGVRKIISIDADFDIYRLPNKVQIENVFLI